MFAQPMHSLLIAPPCGTFSDFHPFQSGVKYLLGYNLVIVTDL